MRKASCYAEGFSSCRRLLIMPNITHNATALNTRTANFSSAILPIPQLTVAEDSDLAWFLGVYDHWSAPVIDGGNGYVTFPRTLSSQEFLEYWRSPSHVIAIRYSATTRELAIDIDRHSPYHSPEGIDQILSVLEFLGLCGYLLHHSSASGGYHIRVPLPEARNTYAAARALRCEFLKAGLTITKGVLEIFPNQKGWVDRGIEYPKGQKIHHLKDYDALRVPLQEGFELLDDWFDPIPGGETLEIYRHHWQWAAQRQDLETFDQWVDYYADPKNQPKPNRFKGGKLVEMERDYRKFIETGWTDFGQTNRILAQITRLTAIFNPWRDAQELATKVYELVVTLPGYTQYCRHRHQMKRRCLQYAQSAIKRGYYYFGDRCSARRRGEKAGPNNSERQTKAIAKLLKGLQGFIKNGFSFATKTQLIAALIKAVGSSKATIQKYWSQFADLTTALIGAPNPSKQAQTQTEKESTGTDTHKSVGALNLPLDSFFSSSPSQKSFNPPPPTPPASLLNKPPP